MSSAIGFNNHNEELTPAPLVFDDFRLVRLIQPFQVGLHVVGFAGAGKPRHLQSLILLVKPAQYARWQRHPSPHSQSLAFRGVARLS